MTEIPAQSGRLSRELEQRIRQALRDLRFGTVTLVVQDGKVIQLDKNEKIRLQ